VTLPGPEATHRWQGRTLVDHDGEPLGSIEAIYLDKATDQPEWALLEAGASSPSRTFVPLVSANEEGDSVRVPFANTLIKGAPGMAADRELSEDQEQELYRHYGVPYSRTDSPSGLPAGEPEPTESALAAGGPPPAEAPISTSTPEVAAGKPEVTAEEPTTAAEEPLPADSDARPEAAAPEPAPIPTSAVAPAPGRVDATVAEASATNDGLIATRPLRVTNARVGAGAAALALAVGIWRRETIGRQLSTAVSRLGTIPATVSRQRRRRRRAKALNQAVTAATQQSTALARGTARLVTGTALLPVTVVMRGGRGVRAAGQATGKAISQGVSRVRPGRRRKRRGGTLGMAVGGAAGYVLGAKAGRERHEQLVEAARRWRRRPEVRRLSEQAVARLDRLSGQAADKLQAARQSTGAETSSSGGPPTTVVPETPTVTPPAPTVVPPVDLAPMPAEPPVLPGEDASGAEERQRSAPPGPLP
jgi:PRC-barrel domain